MTDDYKELTYQTQKLKSELDKTNNRVFIVEKELENLKEIVKAHEKIVPSINMRFEAFESQIMQKIDAKDNLVLEEVRLIKADSDNYRVEQLERQLALEKENNKYKNRTIIGLVCTILATVVGALFNYFLL